MKLSGIKTIEQLTEFSAGTQFFFVRENFPFSIDTLNGCVFVSLHCGAPARWEVYAKSDVHREELFTTLEEAKELQRQKLIAFHAAELKRLQGQTEGTEDGDE